MGSSEGQELIWVDKELAEEYKKIGDVNEQKFMIHEYIEKVSEESKSEFKANLENLEEDVAIYKGLMLGVKQAFEKAKNEQLNASYELWEKFEAEIPRVGEKVKTITDKLNPMKEQLDGINKSIDSINTHRLEKILGLVDTFRHMSDESRNVMNFLINNFSKEA